MSLRTLEPPVPAGTLMPPLPEILPNAHELVTTEVMTAEGPFADLGVRTEPLRRPTPLALPHLPPARIKALRAGSYLIKLTSVANPLSVEDGILRVESHVHGRTASGDLYKRPILFLPPIRGPRPVVRGPVLAPAPRAADGVPVLPRSRYRHYMCVTRMLEGFTLANSFLLGFDSYRFDQTTRTWTNEGAFTAQMTWTAAPAEFSSPQDYLEGDVKNSAGTVVAKLTMGWVAPALRKAVVEIDRVPNVDLPADNGLPVTDPKFENWHTVFAKVGWDTTMVDSNPNVPEPSGPSWNEAELHRAMLTWRDTADLDHQWRFYLLCVQKLDMTDRGIMFDAYGGDSNNIPREGAAIAGHWQIPDTPAWGRDRGKLFEKAKAAYFRTAVHEISHAMMLFHPASPTGNEIMQVTPQIVANAIPPVQFPDNIHWNYLPQDARVLRHSPDVVVRPGSVLRFGTDVGPGYTGMPLSPLDLDAEIDNLTLQVTPLLDTVPLGAPVRVRFDLLNTGNVPIPVPKMLSFKSGLVTGQVIDPSGTPRTFSTILRSLDEFETLDLQPNRKHGDSLTLLRGPEGALFTSPGLYRIVVTIAWDGGGAPIRLSGETTVMVNAAVSEEHARAARRILDTPDTLLTLVVGGDHVLDGISAIQDALQVPVLRPHFAYTEARRLAQRFGSRKPDYKSASTMLTDDTVMSPAEIRKAVTWFTSPAVDAAAAKAVAGTLKKKAKALDVGDEIRAMADSL